MWYYNFLQLRVVSTQQKGRTAAVCVAGADLKVKTGLNVVAAAALNGYANQNIKPKQVLRPLLGSVLRTGAALGHFMGKDK